MQWRNTARRYGAVAQVFHWLIVIPVINQLVLTTGRALYHHFARKDDVLRRMLPEREQAQ